MAADYFVTHAQVTLKQAAEISLADVVSVLIVTVSAAF